MDRQEGARVTDNCELPNLGAKSKSRGLTHVVHVHISSENNQRREKKSTFKKSWPLGDQETTHLVRLLRKHADLNSDHKHLCHLRAHETIADRQSAL